MKELWDIALAEAIKAQGATSPSGGTARTRPRLRIRTNGAVIGLNWDSTGYNLRADGFGYHRAEGRRVRLEPGLRADGQREERRSGA